jgi:Leucine-rich repeat (LRR) protein
MTTFNIEEYLDYLPEDIKKLDLLSKGLTYLPTLERFKNLQELDCSDNQLTSLPSLPSSLQKLYCIVNHLSSLPPLPSSLQELYCYDNQLATLPPLPSSLQGLYCGQNQITSLPPLPSSLQELYCGDNQLNSLPPLPSCLQALYCGENQLSFTDILSWRTFDKFRTTYYRKKFGPKLERYFLNIMKKRKQQLNNELLYSPYLKFYKQFADPITLETMKN